MCSEHIRTGSQSLQGRTRMSILFMSPWCFSVFSPPSPRGLGLVTGILILPQRQTALVAKQTAEVDVLERGTSASWYWDWLNYVEYDALGEKFQTRGRRAEEQIEVLRKLWTQPLVTHKTAHHVIDNAGINPLPMQRPIPIWYGGAAEPVLGAARLGLTGGCQVVGHRTIGLKPTSSSSMAISKRLAAIAKGFRY